jgi:hypothetical protein
MLLNHYFFAHPFKYGTAFLVKKENKAMPEERINPQPDNDQNVERNEDLEHVNDDRYESDTQRIIRRHLENKDDIITDEDIASVRVGVTPPQFDEATAARFEDEDAREEAEEEILGDTDHIEEEENSDDDKLTPWDTVDPK